MACAMLMFLLPNPLGAEEYEAPIECPPGTAAVENAAHVWSCRHDPNVKPVKHLVARKCKTDADCTKGTACDMSIHLPNAKDAGVCR
jgi:hypothetical protein